MNKIFIFFFYLVSFQSVYGQKELSHIVTPEMFGVKANDISAARKNSECLQEALNYAARHGKTLVSSAGNHYYISKGLEINDFVDIDFGRATIIATDTCEMFLVQSGKRRKWAGTIRNLQLDLNNIAKCGIYCENAIKLKIEDVGIVGIKMNSCGLTIMQGYEVFAENMHFEGGQNKATGISVYTHDCHFQDCVMIDCHTAVECWGSNFFERIHAWIGNKGKYLEGSSFFKIRNAGPVFLHQCFSDTYEIAFNIMSKTELYISQLKNYHNKLMWQKDTKLIHPELFHFSDEKIAKESFVVVENSSLGGLVIDGVNRQKFSNVGQDVIKLQNSFLQK